MGMKIRGERKAFSIEVWFFSYYFILFLRLHFFYLSQCMRLITFGGWKYLSSDRRRRKKKFWAKNNRQQRKNILSNHQQPTEEQGNLIDRIVVEDWKINFDKWISIFFLLPFLSSCLFSLPFFVIGKCVDCVADERGHCVADARVHCVTYERGHRVDDERWESQCPKSPMSWKGQRKTERKRTIEWWQSIRQFINRYVLASI